MTNVRLCLYVTETLTNEIQTVDQNPYPSAARNDYREMARRMARRGVPCRGRHRLLAGDIGVNPAKRIAGMMMLGVSLPAFFRIKVAELATDRGTGHRPRPVFRSQCAANPVFERL